MLLRQLVLLSLPLAAALGVTYTTFNFAPHRGDWSGHSEFLLQDSAYGGGSDASAIAAFCAALGHPAALDFQADPRARVSACYGFDGQEWQTSWCTGSATRHVITAVTCAASPEAAPEAALEVPEAERGLEEAETLADAPDAASLTPLPVHSEVSVPLAEPAALEQAPAPAGLVRVTPAPEVLEGVAQETSALDVPATGAPAPEPRARLRKPGLGPFADKFSPWPLLAGSAVLVGAVGAAHAGRRRRRHPDSPRGDLEGPRSPRVSPRVSDEATSSGSTPRSKRKSMTGPSAFARQASFELERGMPERSSLTPRTSAGRLS